MADDKKVIVYSTPTCPYCKQIKAYLKEKGIEYDDIDVAANPDKAQEMIDKSGQMGVPVIDIAGEFIVGFDKEKIDKALGL
jgi:glutaredoxin 3